MLQFQEFVNEAFDTKPVKWRKKNANHYWFQIDDNIYDVTFEKESSGIEVSFTIDQGEGTSKIVSMAGTGNQYQVLVTVVDILKAFIKANPKETKYTFSTFDSESSARARVYIKLLQKFLSKDKWTFTALPTTNRRGTFTMFTLSKIT